MPTEVLPEISALLAAQAAAGPLDASLPVSRLRAACDAGIVAMHPLVRDLGTPTTVQDRTVAVPGGAIPVRLYLPERAAQDGMPVHVHLHGGGWWMGSIETADPMARELCVGADMAVLSVGYRLAPEHPWPTAAEDVYAAVEWLATGTGVGFRPTSVSIGGESAGANLAVVAALMCRDRGGPPLVAQWLDVPAVDLTMPETASAREFGSGYGLELAQMQLIRRWYVDDQHLSHPYVSPALAPDLGGLPPTILTTAELDPLRDSGEKFAVTLRSADVEVALHRAVGHIHGSTWLTALAPATASWHDAVVGELVRHHRAVAVAR